MKNEEFLINYERTSKKELERYHQRYTNSNLYYPDYLQLRKPHVKPPPTPPKGGEMGTRDKGQMTKTSQASLRLAMLF